MTKNPDTVVLSAGRPELADQVTELVWSTGPSSYSYIFGTRALFDAFVAESWRTPATYFGYSEAIVAMHGEEVLGLEIGSPGARNHETRANLALVSHTLLEKGVVDAGELAAVLKRADKASWLNPFIPPGSYYILALAVLPETRKTGLGARLLANAMERGRQAGSSELHLDVLSDNPAVGFYRSRGLETVCETIAPEPFANGVPMEMRMTIAIEGAKA